METVFLGCFLFGLVFSAASFVLGFAGAHAGHGHGDGHHLPLPHWAHGHGNGGGHGHAEGGADGRQPLVAVNFSAVVAFLAWFGAGGYALSRLGAPAPLALVVALLAGLAGGYLVARFMATLRAGERVMDPEEYRLVGTVARVTVGIPSDGVGEIVFTKVGTLRSEAARAARGAAIPRQTEVVITGYDRGVAMVEPWETFVNGEQEVEK
jgi:membrane protein implicated in regulation of membrane protease activity